MNDNDSITPNNVDLSDVVYRSNGLADDSSETTPSCGSPCSSFTQAASLNLDHQEEANATQVELHTEQQHEAVLPNAAAVAIEDTETTASSDWSPDDLFDEEIEAVKVGGELSMSAIDERYNKRLETARICSYVFFLISTLQGSVCIGLGIKHQVISLTTNGAQILIDLLSSVMIIWRFYSRSGRTRRHPRHADTDYKLREALREKRAAFGVGVLLLLTSIWAASWAFVRVFGIPPPPAIRLQKAIVALSVAWPGFLIFTIIAGVKWTYGIRLNSRVLQKDAVCTTFGAALSFVTALFATIDYAVLNPTNDAAGNTGAADAVAALIMAALIMVEGIRTIYQNTIGWIAPSGVTKEVVQNYYTTRRPGKDTSK